MKSDTLCLVNSIGDFGKDVGNALNPANWFRVSLDICEVHSDNILSLTTKYYRPPRTAILLPIMSHVLNIYKHAVVMTLLVKLASRLLKRRATQNVGLVSGPFRRALMTWTESALQPLNYAISSQRLVRLLFKWR